MEGAGNSAGDDKNFLLYYWVDDAGKKIYITAVVYGKRDQGRELQEMDLDILPNQEMDGLLINQSFYDIINAVNYKHYRNEKGFDVDIKNMLGVVYENLLG